MLIKQQIPTEPKLYLNIGNLKRIIYQLKDNFLAG